MQKHKFDSRTETKPSLSRQVVESQRDEHEARDTRLPQRGPFAPVISGIGDTSSAGVHASMLNRATNGRPSRAGQSLLRLQRQYGNRYVQRVLALAGKSTGEAESAPEVEQSIQQARGGGHGIDSRVRGQMEPAFGANFSNVRLHTDTQADTLNRKLNARAFTTGQDIFFRQGAYNPGSSSGRELLAHELTHVVQQNGKKVQRKLTVGQPGDRYEQEADQVARAVMQQEQRPVQRDSDEGLVRRQIEEEEEEELIQTKLKDTWVQRQLEEEEEEEEEETVQAKPDGVWAQRRAEEKGKLQTFRIKEGQGQPSIITTSVQRTGNILQRTKCTVLNGTNNEQKSAKSALKIAAKMTNNAQIRIGGKRRGRYKTWFDTNYSSANATAKTRFNKVKKGWVKVHDVFQSKRIYFDCSARNESYYAEVDTSDGKYKLKLGKDFWTAAGTGRDSKGGAIVHEISHEEVYTDDHVYGEADAKQLAQNDATKAVDNADNWEYYAEDSY